jgi:ATP-dependent Clp protease protease subunit
MREWLQGRPRVLLVLSGRGSSRSDRVRHLLASAQRRIIFLGSPVDGQVANLVVAQLLRLESVDPDKDISI